MYELLCGLAKAGRAKRERQSDYILSVLELVLGRAASERLADCVSANTRLAPESRFRFGVHLVADLFEVFARHLRGRPAVDSLLNAALPFPASMSASRIFFLVGLLF